MLSRETKAEWMRGWSYGRVRVMAARNRAEVHWLSRGFRPYRNPSWDAGYVAALSAALGVI